MKTLVSMIIAGALSTQGVFAGASSASRDVTQNDNTIATPKLPLQLFHKRPAGARQSAAMEKTVNVASPQLPFRPYQKRPTATPSNTPSGTEAANRQ
jgi:hypothetical protein